VPPGARSTTKQRPARARFGRRLSQAGPAPASGVGIGVRFSEGGIESLVRPGSWRRLRRFAGRTGASSVACRGLTPDPVTAIRAVTGSGVDAGQVGGTRSIKNQLLERRPSANVKPYSFDSQATSQGREVRAATGPIGSIDLGRYLSCVMGQAVKRVATGETGK
jgi:hypothetical protein